MDGVSPRERRLLPGGLDASEDFPGGLDASELPLLTPIVHCVLYGTTSSAGACAVRCWCCDVKTLRCNRLRPKMAPATSLWRKRLSSQGDTSHHQQRTAQAPVEGRGHRQVAPLEGKTANTPRLGPVSTSRQRIAELARQALGMAVAIAWLPGPAGTRRRVAKLSVEEPDAAEPARPDLWGARVSNDPGLPDPTQVATE